MSMPQICRWREFDSSAELERSACRAILDSAAQAIAARGAFHIVLSGGGTPRHVYQMLRDADTDWPAWHVYFGDERCLPAGYPERNSQMARSVWLAHVGIPDSQVHEIACEADPAEAAERYAQQLASMQTFDLVLLGLGEDGHTASLFPGKSWEHAQNLASVLAVYDAPKPPDRRVTLSPARLSQSLQVLYLVSGKSKLAALTQWRAGVALPASCICPPTGVDIFWCGEDQAKRSHP